ncbi:MAG: phage holin family protein [Burkholderiales bacterium]|nr:phage holin family protein [Burkholderiales bacterium]
MSDPGDAAPRGSTLSGALSRLADALLGLARTRLELASVEYAEERGRVGMQLALVLAGVGCLLFAAFFTAFGVVAYFWDSHRIAAIVGVIIFFILAGAALLWRRAELANAAGTPFAATVAELDKDRAALTRTFHSPRP